MVIEVDGNKNILTVVQELTYYNQSNDTLTYIVLNDWVNAYANKSTPMGKRFSDEFERSFHLAHEKERGYTNNLTVIDAKNSFLAWQRNKSYPDVIHIKLREKLAPNQKTTLSLTYITKIPSDKFTHFGYGEDGKMNLKNFLLTPARYENSNFIKYDNLNLDDIANSLSDYDLEVRIPSYLFLNTDLNQIQKTTENQENYYIISGKNRMNFNLCIDKERAFEVYKNNEIEVVTNLKETRLNEINKAILIDNITTFVSQNLGKYPHKKIVITQADYDRNPFYGLNQLPIFVSPFPDDFLFEIKFLKTYLNNYLQNTLQLDPRKDNWIFDGIQVYTMMKYIDTFHPDSKMMGNVANMKLLRGYNLVSLDFNGQYSYFYMLMARQNLDQPLSNSKNTLIRFNEKIASKYRAGLSLNYLDQYLDQEVVPASMKQFIALNHQRQCSRKDFETILKLNSPKNINWFFNTLIDSREIIDYKFDVVTKTADSVSFSITNKTKTDVPIPVYGIKNKQIVFKKWFDTIKKDSLYTLPRHDAEKIVINYKNEVPEYNLRNNWKSLKGFRINNRPIKFNFMKDLEDPYYNQILYVPSLEYNYYDGLLPGFRFHNRTILNKPFIYDINPTISTKTSSISGRANFIVNHFYRDSKLFNVTYHLNGHYLHYLPDAYYTKVSPAVSLNFRPADLRNNRKESIVFKEIFVHKEESAFVESTENDKYNVFNAKYINTKTEVTNHYYCLGDVQYSKEFGKLSTEIQYRKLFDNNHLLNLRLFAGTFLYNHTTSTYFDFGLDRPSDYLFESDYLGRSETTGLFSQQSILSEGFFKSKLQTRFANQWMVTTNGSISVWNWIELYGDLGLVKNKLIPAKFVYDSGIRLNLVTDYFELYFPVYSNNGWEISQNKYGEKIRFIVSFSPKTLTNLFTRKWF